MRAILGRGLIAISVLVTSYGVYRWHLQQGYVNAFDQMETGYFMKTLPDQPSRPSKAQLADAEKSRVWASNWRDRAIEDMKLWRLLTLITTPAVFLIWTVSNWIVFGRLHWKLSEK